MRIRRLLCGCLTDAAAERLGEFFRHPEVDLLEWRLDVFFRRYGRNGTIENLSALSALPGHPVIATIRPKSEGGEFEGSEEARMKILHKAIAAGAEWVDLEDRVGDEEVRGFRSQGARVLISHHDFSLTPNRSTLEHLVETMARKGPDAIKIVTTIRDPEDNLRVLELIPFGRRQLGMQVIAFGMGPLGRWSRAVSLLLGSPWAYVQLPELSPAAEGQYTATEMKRLLRQLEPDGLDSTMLPFFSSPVPEDDK